MSNKEAGGRVGTQEPSHEDTGSHFKKSDKCFGVRQNYFQNLILLFTIYMI